MYAEYRNDALEPTIQRISFAEPRKFEESDENSLKRRTNRTGGFLSITVIVDDHSKFLAQHIAAEEAAHVGDKLSVCGVRGFSYRKDPVPGNICKALDNTARPANLDVIRPCALAQAKVESE